MSEIVERTAAAYGVQKRRESRLAFPIHLAQIALLDNAVRFGQAPLQFASPKLERRFPLLKQSQRKGSRLKERGNWRGRT